MDPKRHPKAYKMAPQVSQEAPKMAKAFPKAPQGVTRFPKVSPRAPQGLPKGSQGAPAERSWNLHWAKIGSKTSPQNGVPKGTPLKKQFPSMLGQKMTHVQRKTSKTLGFGTGRLSEKKMQNAINT